MDPSEHMVLTKPMRLEPWIRNYDISTGRDERQAAEVRYMEHIQSHERSTISLPCEQCSSLRSQPFTPSVSTLLSMPRFASARRAGTLDPDYASPRANELPVTWQIAQS